VLFSPFSAGSSQNKMHHLMRIRCDWKDLAGIFSVSLSSLAFEILIIRCLSITMWYHFAFMVISVAMLGFGASGTVVTGLQMDPSGKPSKIPAWSTLLFSVNMVLSIVILSGLNPDLFCMGHDISTLLTLGLIYILLTAPFFWAGLTIALLLKEKSETASLLYGTDLVGAGLGCLLIIPLIQEWGLPGAVLLFSSVTAIGALMLSVKRFPALKWISAFTAVLFAVGTPWISSVVKIQPGPDKMLSFYAKNSESPFRQLFLQIQEAINQDYTSRKIPIRSQSDIEILSTSWDKLCRIDTAAYADRHPIYGIGMATTYRGTLPGQIMITQDGDAATFITRHDGNFTKLNFIDRFLYGLPYAFRQYRNAMIIGAGGGTDVLAALKHDTASIHAVELNPGTVKAVREEFAEFAGHIYSNPRVHVTVGEGRSVLSRSKERYDLIQMTGVDTWASSSQGAYVLSENFLYTVESFQSYYDHLNTDGVLSIVRARFLIPRETLRLCSLAIEMLECNGIDDPQNRIIVVTEPTHAPNVFAGFLLKKGSWTQREIREIKRFCDQADFRIVGGAGCEETTPFSVLLSSDKRERIYREYPFDIRPVTDDKPYFFKLHRWSHIRMPKPMARIMGVDLGGRPGTGHESGLSILLLLFFQASFLSVVLIVIPFLRGHHRISSPDRLYVGMYFLGLGLGFMFVEISLIQLLTLFLGYPSRSITVTLCMLLIGSGIGSLLSSRIHSIKPRTFTGLCVLVWAVSTLYALGLPVVTHGLLHLTDTVRQMISIGIAGFPGIWMGFLFPLGIRSAGQKDSSHVAWAWCVNGCASVLGSIMAVFISMTFGFRILFLLGGCVYLLSGLAGRKLALLR
jgi:Spermine/spermidine synthase domain